MRVMRLVTVSLLLGMGTVASLLAFRTVFVSGMGWDAAFESYASLLIRPIDPATTGLQQAYDIAPVDSEFYGVLIYQVVDGFRTVFLGASEWLPFASADTYLWIFGANAIGALVGICALSIAVGVVMRSWLMGAFAWAMMATTPLFIGHASMNYKDMPVAAGLCLVSAALMLGWALHRRWAAGLCAAVLSFAGAVMAMGSRGGALVLLVGLVGGSLVTWLLMQRRLHRWANWWITAVGTGMGVVAATGVILWSNPIARINPLQWLPDSIARAGQYPWQGPIRINGVDVISTDLPWWYVPVWLMAQLPLLTIVLLAASVCFAVVAFVRRTDFLPRRELIPLVPLAMQAIVLPILVVASGPVLYDGLRHLLFMIPAQVALGVIGLRGLVGLAQRGAIGRQTVPLVVAVLVAGASLFAVVRWYPYQYAYLNPIAGWDKEHRNWEVDYWGLSGREGVARLLEQGAPLVLVLPNGDSSSLFGGTRSRELIERWPKGAWQYGIYTFQRWENYLPGNCRETIRIERDGILIGNGGLCPPPVEILKAEAAAR